MLVAYPNRGAGNDPKLFFFFFGGGMRGGSLSPPRLNIFTVGLMRVMICLGPGGLRSLSAFSLLLNLMNYKCWMFTCLTPCSFSEWYLTIPLSVSLVMQKLQI